MLSRRSVLRTGAAAAALAAIPAPARARKPSGSSDRSARGSSSVSFEAFALSRFAFGPRASDLAALEKLSLRPEQRFGAWLESQLRPSMVPDPMCEKRLAQAGLATLAKPMKRLWAEHAAAAKAMKNEIDAESRANKPEAEIKRLKRERRELQKEPALETEQATWIRAVYSERQLFEAMTSFWHNHFNVYAWDNKIAPTFVQFDRDVIRKNALGNFRILLEDMASSPAMLLYLDNAFNQSGNPNENFARELFELHTLGAENYLGTRDRASVTRIAGKPAGYVDGDVYEAARAFTGWRVDQGKKSNETGAFEYYEQWHDRFQKVVLGQPLKEYQPPMKDGRDVLDLLSEHPGTARFVCRKLCRRFVSDHPSEAFVEKIAKVFHDARKAPDQIAQTIRAIALSKDFSSSRGQKLATPFEATVSFLRATGADFQPSEPFLRAFEATGRRLFAWKTPDGFPESGDRWLSANVIIERLRLLNRALIGNLEGVDVDFDKLGLKGSPSEFLARLEQDVLRRPLSDDSRSAIEDFLDKHKGRPRRFQFATAMAFMAPESQRT